MASNLYTVSYPSGVQTQFQYDTLNRVSALATQKTGRVYQRGPTGNLTGTTELIGRTLSWTYDGIFRLTNETISLAPSQPRPDPANAGIPMPFADQSILMNHPLRVGFVW